MGAPEERAALQQSLEEHRRELQTAVEQLKEAARSWTDPREPIRERPVPWLLGGLALGIWLGWRP
jgi:hypothetical protein